MKRPRRAAFLVAAAAGVVFCVSVALRRPLPLAGASPADGFTRVAGAIHVHTRSSDGSGTPEEVAAAARRAGLDFVVVTDHNLLDAQPAEGVVDGVLLLVGVEVSTTAGHVVAVGLRDPAFRFSGDAVDVEDDLRHLGAQAFVAHPTSPREDFRWTGGDLPGDWGLEIANGDSQWRSAGWLRLARTLLLYPLNTDVALLGTLSSPQDALDRWDAVLARRPAVAIAGSDAHARIALGRRWSVDFPSYEAVFRLARTHVLLPRPLGGSLEPDRALLLDALRRGHAYVGIDALADAGGIAFTAEAGGERWTMGDSLAPRPGLVLRAGGRMPEGTAVRLLRDGRVVGEGRGEIRLSDPPPGIYRMEAWVPGEDRLPWVVTNAIAIRPEAELAAREARIAPAPDAPVPVEVTDGFEAAPGLQAAGDTLSASALAIEPEGEGHVARWDFRLGTPAPDHPDVFAALVDGRPRDLRGREGLSLRVRADGEYRVWVQVRDENPASRDEGTEWWFASVRTGPGWQRVALPFARLRSLNPATDGRLDLDRVRALVLVIDKGSVKPGTAGRIWLDEVGAY